MNFHSTPNTFTLPRRYMIPIPNTIICRWHLQGGGQRVWCGSMCLFAGHGGGTNTCCTRSLPNVNLKEYLVKSPFPPLSSSFIYFRYAQEIRHLIASINSLLPHSKIPNNYR